MTKIPFNHVFGNSDSLRLISALISYQDWLSLTDLWDIGAAVKIPRFKVGAIVWKLRGYGVVVPKTTVQNTRYIVDRDAAMTKLFDRLDLLVLQQERKQKIEKMGVKK